MFHRHTLLRAAVRRPYVAAAGGSNFPFDVYGTALWWGGLRAYSSTTAGSAPAIRLLKTSDGVTQGNIGMNATTGMLNTGDSFFTDGPPSGTLYQVVNIYDQLGGGNDLGVGDQIYYLVLDGSLPCITHSGGSSGYMLSPNHVVSSQPFTFSFVGMGAGTDTIMYKDNAQNQFVGFDQGGAPNNAYAYGGNSGAPFTASATDNVFHAVQSVFNGAASSICVDGATPVTGTIDDPANFLDGIVVISIPPGAKFRESGVWAGDKSSSFAAMNTQQRGRWTDIP